MMQFVRNSAGIMLYIVPAALVYHATASWELAMAVSYVAVLNLVAAYGVQKQVVRLREALTIRGNINDNH